MAPPQDALQEEDFLFLKGLKSVLSEGGKTFHLIFEWLSGKAQNQSFREYFLTQTEYNSNTKLKKIFDKDQRKALDSDSLDQTKEFDISFLYVCIRYGCPSHHLISGDDGWTEGDESSAKSNFTTVKNFRNSLCHVERKFSSEAELEAFLEGLQKYLELLLRQSAAMAHIGQPEVDQRVKEMKENIEKIKEFPLTEDDIERYKAKVSEVREALKEMVQEKGRDELKKNYKRIIYLDPLSSISRMKPVKVCMVFMAMEAMREKETQPLQGKPLYSAVDYRDTLELMTESGERPMIILVEGDAGAGKSTLLKLLVAEWDGDDLPHGSSPTIKGIQDYDLVIHNEFKKSINSFESLLSALLPETSREMREKDLLRSVLSLKILLALDGLDEVHKDSAKLLQQLFDEILPRSNGKMQMLITTRPHKVPEILALCHNMPKLHLKLSGIKPEKRTDFVRTLHNELLQGGQSAAQTDPLVDHVERLQAQMGEHLSRPLTLSLITFLWAADSKRVESIRTVAGLYIQLQAFQKERLITRLQKGKYFCHDREVLKGKCDKYLELLFEKSLDTHARGLVEFPEEYCKDLRDKCEELELPPNEMCAAFLNVRREQTLFELKLYLEHPHKSALENDAAQGILLQLCQMKKEGQDASIEDALKKKLGDPITEEKLEHFHEVLKYLSTHMIAKGKQVFEDNAEQLCRILIRSGMTLRTRYSWNPQEYFDELNEKWMDFLQQLNGHDLVTQFVASNAEKEGVRVMDIRDGHCRAAVAILKRRKSFPSLEMIKIFISSDGKLIPELEALMDEVSTTDCEVVLHLDHHWRNQEDGSHLVRRLLTKNRRCRVVDLKTHLEDPCLIPPEAKRVRLSLRGNIPEMVKELGRHERDVIMIHLSLSHPLPHTHSLTPLPGGRGHLWLFLSEVSDGDGDRVVQLLRALQPLDGNYWNISFPRSSLTRSGTETLLCNMAQEGVRVGGSLDVSSSSITPAEETELRDVCRQHLKCHFDLKSDK